MIIYLHLNKALNTVLWLNPGEVCRYVDKGAEGDTVTN